MNWNKLNPWNWFRKEENDGGNVPVQRADTPAQSLALMHGELDRLFDNWMRGFGFPTTLGRFDRLGTGLLKPSVDISENSKAYTIRAEIPGVEKEDIKIRLDGDTLVISGEKKQEKESEEGGYHCVERSYGSFRRTLCLPEDADADKLEAKFRNGVLTLTVPRLAESARPGREITIS